MNRAPFKGEFKRISAVGHLAGNDKPYYVHHYVHIDTTGVLVEDTVLEQRKKERSWGKQREIVEQTASKIRELIAYRDLAADPAERSKIKYKLQQLSQKQYVLTPEEFETLKEKFPGSIR